jgi:hypothetical protein
MTNTMDLVSTSRPFGQDANGAVGYDKPASLAQVRAMSAKPVRQTPHRTDYSRTRVSGKAPSKAMLGLLRIAVEGGVHGEVFLGNNPVSVTTMRSTATRGLGTLIYSTTHRNTVLGFRINDAGRKALAAADAPRLTVAQQVVADLRAATR